MYLGVEDGRLLFERLTAPSGGTETDYQFDSAPLLRVLPARHGGTTGRPVVFEGEDLSTRRQTKRNEHDC